MASNSLDDRILALQQQNGAEMPQPPISTDNSDGGRPLIRVPIYKSDTPLNEAQPGDVAGTGASNLPTPIGSDASGGGAIEAAAPTQGLGETSAQDGNALPQPTPEDNTAQIIADRRAQAIEALKADGFDGYTPDITSGTLNEDDQAKVGSAIQDIAAGFNISLARAISLPREVVDRGLGLLGLDYMQHGGPQQQTIDALNRMGIPTYEVENLANKIGKGALPALATYTAMQLAAPSMAANTGVGAASYLGRNIGEWALKHPVVGLWLGQSAQAGGKVAQHVTGSDNPLIEFGGELAGGGAPGALKFAVSKVPGVMGATKLAGKGLSAGAEMIATSLPTDLKNAIKKYNPFYDNSPTANLMRQRAEETAKLKASQRQTSLIDPNADVNRLQNFAKDQIANAQFYQDKAIENAINAIPTSGTPAQVQSRTHGLLEQAEKISKRIVSGFWQRVPQKLKVGVTELNRDVLKLRSELSDLDNQRPDTMIDKVLETVHPFRNAKGQIEAPKVTIQKLGDLRSQIGTAITEERARDAPREGMVRNLARLSEMIDEHMAREVPNSTVIEQARQMSKRHNDLFSRGPINDILSKRRSGDFRVPTADSVDTLLQKTDGLAALKAVQEGVSTYPRIPTTKFQSAAMRGNPFAATPAEKDTLDQLVKSAEDSIRTSFREAAEASPQKAVAYSQKNEEAIKALAGVAGELQFAAQRVAGALAQHKAITASALAKFAETSPDKAVANIFAQRDPATTAKQLMLTFRGDPEALEGLRNQVLNHFIYTIGKTNPNVLLKMLHEPRIGNLLEAVLDGDQFSRLSRIINTAVRVGVEDETGFKAILKSPFKTAGQFAGAAFGRKLNTGTIQVPGIFAKRFGTFMENSLGGTDPADLLSQAVLDPKWEQMLYSRIPTSTRDMRIAMDRYKRIFAGINSTQDAVIKRLSKDENSE